jgi:hypothetical protein
MARNAAPSIRKVIGAMDSPSTQNIVGIVYASNRGSSVKGSKSQSLLNRPILVLKSSIQATALRILGIINGTNINP